MDEWIASFGYWGVLATVGAYQVGIFLKKKTGLAVCNPILVAIVLMIPFLLITGISNDAYQQSMKNISWLLTPCTVCLGILLHARIQSLRDNMGAILAGIGAGVIANLLAIAGLCLVLGLDSRMMLSLLPKSTTTAVAVPLAENASALVPLTTISVIVTGIFGSVIGPVLCRWFHIHDDIAVGVAFGTTSHVAGAARAAEESELAGAVGSLAMVVAGIMTAVVISVLTEII